MNENYSFVMSAAAPPKNLYKLTWFSQASEDAKKRAPDFDYVEASDEFLAGMLAAVWTTWFGEWHDINVGGMRIEKSEGEGKDHKLTLVNLDEKLFPYVVPSKKHPEGKAVVPADEKGWRVIIWENEEDGFEYYSQTKELLAGYRFAHRTMMSAAEASDVTVSKDESDPDDEPEMVCGIALIEHDGVEQDGAQLFADWKVDAIPR